MLKTIRTQNIYDCHKTFEQNYTSDTSTWVVSDLTSKLSFQKKIFKNHDVIPDESLCRTQELWFKLFQRIYPDYKIVSKECILFFVNKCIRESDHRWAHKKGAGPLSLQYLTTLMPILADENGHEMMKEYFSQNIPAYERWGHWYILCSEIFQKFLFLKIVHAQWIPSFLVHQTDFPWERELFFDLGAQIQPIEAELILNMSKTLKVNVLVPHADWVGQYPSIANVYEKLGVEFSANSFCYDFDKQNFKKLSTQLSEVQHACEMIRRWVEDDQIEFDKIAVVAPDIGEYWPVLSSYFKCEKIPTSRSSNATLKTFPSIHAWISQMKLKSGEIDYFHLETDVFSTSTDLKFTDFSMNYKNMYSLDELFKNDFLSSKYQQKILNPYSQYKLIDFVSWALSLWSQKDSELIQSLLNTLYQDFPSHIEFSLREWVDIVDQISCKLEVCIEAASPNGVLCLDIMSLKDTDVDRVIALGLSDQALRKNSQVLIQEQEIAYLRDQYGFYLSPVEKSDLEFEVLWNLQDSKRYYELYFSHIHFQSQQLAPSKVWFLGAIEQSKGKVPLTQPQKFKVLADQLQFSVSVRDPRILRDLGEERKNWFHGIPPDRLSASQLEDFLNCPFVNAAKKLYALVDLPDLDLDIDYLTRGQLLHKAAEILIKKYQDKVVSKVEYTEEEIHNALDLAFREQSQRIKDPELWRNQKKRYVRLLQKFIAFEESLRKQFSNIKTPYLETDFIAYIDPSTGEIQKEQRESFIPIFGRFDRVDTDDKDELAVIVDYKFDHKDHKNFNSWLKENQLQLLLYMYALEAGVLGNKYRVIGSLYYGFKTGTREKGYLDKDVDGILYTTGRNKNKGSEEDKQRLYEELKVKIKDAVSRMSDGDYEPNPKDIENCSSCSWRVLCRAPHLI